MRRLCTVLLLGTAMVICSLLESGCAGPVGRVRPWERAALADDVMNPDGDPLGAALSEHVYFSRTAASGGRGVGGSGCGCN
jgi:hypothetical protein